MTKSESVKSLAAALNKAQALLKPAVKDRDNPFFKSTYATLQSVWEAAAPVMAANGLSITQTFSIPPQDCGEVIIETTLMHDSGEWVSSQLALRPVKNDPQAFGSAITYGRRYSLAAILGIVTDDDDDGNGASHVAPPPARHASPKAQEAVAEAPKVEPLCSKENAAKLHEYSKIAIGAKACMDACAKYKVAKVEDLTDAIAVKVIAFIQKEMNK